MSATIVLSTRLCFNTHVTKTMSSILWMGTGRHAKDIFTLLRFSWGQMAVDKAHRKQGTVVGIFKDVGKNIHQ